MSQIKASHKKILEDLLKKDCNKVCADCRAKGTCVLCGVRDARRSSLGFRHAGLLHLHPLFRCAQKPGRSHFVRAFCFS